MSATAAAAPNRYAVQRCHDRQSAVFDGRFCPPTARRNLWRPGRLQLGRRPLAHRHRARLPGLEPTRHRTTVCPGAVCNPGSPLPMLRSPPAQQSLEWSAHCGRASVRWSTPTPLGYFTGGLARPDQNLRHPERVQSHAHPRCLTGDVLLDDMGNPILDANGNQIVLSYPEHLSSPAGNDHLRRMDVQGGLERGRRRRASSRRQSDRQGRVPASRLRQRLRQCDQPACQFDAA